MPKGFRHPGSKVDKQRPLAFLKILSLATHTLQARLGTKPASNSSDYFAPTRRVGTNQTSLRLAKTIYPFQHNYAHSNIANISQNRHKPFNLVNPRKISQTEPYNLDVLTYLG